MTKPDETSKKNEAPQVKPEAGSADVLVSPVEKESEVVKPADSDAAKAKRKAASARRREALRSPKGGIRSKLQMARKVALVAFAIVGAYLIAIYVDLLLKVFTLKHVHAFHPVLQKYLLAPIAFEGGFLIAQLVVLYLVGRFIDLKLWPTLIAMVAGIHLFDFAVKFVLDQAGFAYLNWRLWALRAPLI
ncbi:hypothetical protein KJ865_01850, partial [Myxococcota bacterium]|nr:hypothetical protein [Myxococcota bacterium]